MFHYPVNEYFCGGVYTIVTNTTDESVELHGGFRTKKDAEEAGHAYAKQYSDSTFVKTILAASSNEARKIAEEMQ